MRSAPARTCATIAAWLLALFVVFTSPPGQAAPQDGWWWNPAESGRGFFLDVQGPRMFMAGYLYDADGRATWVVSNDAMPDPERYDGRLLAFRDGQSLMGAYRHPGAPVDAGAVGLRFTDATHGTLTWAGGTVPIQRQDFHHGTAAAFQPRNGWWWNPDESGRGFSIEVQGDHMFIGAYMYDEAGNPVWYVADALMQSPNRFTGPLLQFSNGQTMTGAYRAPGTPATAGTITIDFAAREQATVTLTEAQKAGKIIEIKPQYEKPLTPAAGMWVGGFKETVYFDEGDIHSKQTSEAVTMTWAQDTDLITPDRGYPAFYKIAAGFVVVDIELTAPGCTGSGAGSAGLGAGDGELTVNRDGTYTGSITKEIEMQVTATCEGQSVTRPAKAPLDIRFMGKLLEGGNMHELYVNDTIPGFLITLDWTFTPRP